MTAVTPSSYVIGKARVGFRAIGVLTPYTVVETLADTVIRLNADGELFDPSTELDLGGPIIGFQYVPRVGAAQIEFSVGALTAANLALLFPGSTSVTPTPGITGGGGSSTLSAATAVGDTSITVASATNFAVGDVVRIDTSTLIEYRTITLIASTTFSFFAPLSIAHASGVAVVEYDSDGRTTITPPAPGRISTSSYKEFRVDWPRPDTSPGTLLIYRGLAQLDSPYELTTGARTMGRIRVTITAYRNDANVEAAPVALLQ